MLDVAIWMAHQVIDPETSSVLYYVCAPPTLYIICSAAIEVVVVETILVLLSVATMFGRVAAARALVMFWCMVLLLGS